MPITCSARLQRAGARAAAGKSGPLHVLLIEDDTTIADMYRVQLEYDGYQVTLASTASAGMSDIASTNPDIILLDLLLPDRSGLEVMAQIKETFPAHPPVVILSNYGEPTMIERGLALGAVEYLVKSRVTPESVSRSIPGWVEIDRDGESPHYQ
jgi:DNA-binding response OmpR family regulator